LPLVILEVINNRLITFFCIFGLKFGNLTKYSYGKTYNLIPLQPENHFFKIKLVKMEQLQMQITSLLKEVTGKSNIETIDFRNIDNIDLKDIETRKVRGSVRLMSGNIKTPAQVEKMRDHFISRQLP